MVFSESVTFCTNSIILCFVVTSFQEDKGSKRSWVWLADKEENEIKFVWAEIGCTILDILINESKNEER